MTPRIDEVATDLFRISLYVPQFDLQFNHFLIRDEEPLLFHTGLRGMFPGGCSDRTGVRRGGRANGRRNPLGDPRREHTPDAVHPSAAQAHVPRAGRSGTCRVRVGPHGAAGRLSAVILRALRRS
jgi:hypothetical protein